MKTWKKVLMVLGGVFFILVVAVLLWAKWYAVHN